ncbi:hypothetical protein BDZ89DRAFT_244390 [Hymenopellis radicata]|nr:hypothetical protein BDZ89DRAFT_244390 [Hymenopellis radicata]
MGDIRTIRTSKNADHTTRFPKRLTDNTTRALTLRLRSRRKPAYSVFFLPPLASKQRRSILILRSYLGGKHRLITICVLIDIAAKAKAHLDSRLIPCPILWHHCGFPAWR